MNEKDLKINQFYMNLNNNSMFLVTEIKNGWTLGIEVGIKGSVRKDSGYNTYIFLEKFKPITEK